MSVCYGWVPVSLSRDVYKWVSPWQPQTGYSLEERQTRKVLQNSVRNAAFHLYTLPSALWPSSTWEATPRDGTGKSSLQGWPLNQIVHWKNEKGISSRETGICNSAETFNSIVWEATKRSRAGRRALGAEAGPDHGLLGAYWGAWVSPRGPHGTTEQF